MITKQEFGRCVTAYKNNDINDSLMLQVLEKLADSLLNKLRKVNTSSQDIASFCLSKLNKFDSDRGVAYNFCTTIMLCYARQFRQRKTNDKN